MKFVHVWLQIVKLVVYTISDFPLMNTCQLVCWIWLLCGPSTTTAKIARYYLAFREVKKRELVR